MQDLPIIIAFSLLIIFSVWFAQWEREKEVALADCAAVNAMIWIEGEATTNRLNECKKRRKK